MTHGICRLCLDAKDLQKSHAIPNAMFKRIFNRNNGTAIEIRDDESTPIGYSDDSWWEYQLCKGCETHLNVSYEHYSISALRGSAGVEFEKKSSGLKFDCIDLKKLTSYFISIIWRCANSNNHAYRNITLKQHQSEKIRSLILNKEKIPLRFLSVKLSRIKDDTPDGFDLDLIKQAIISPFLREKNNSISINFALEGFFIEVNLSGLRLKDGYPAGILNPSQRSLFVPYVDMFSIPEILHVGVAAIRKKESGNINL